MRKNKITNDLIRSCFPANLIESFRVKNLKLILERNDDRSPPGPPPEGDGREIEGFSPDSPYNGDPNNGFINGVGLYDFQQALDDAGIGGPNGPSDIGFPNWMQAIIASYGIPPWLVDFYIQIANQHGIPPHILSGYLGWSGSSDAWSSIYMNMYIDLSFLGMPGMGYHFSVNSATGQWSAAPALVPIQQYSGFWNGTAFRPYAFNYSGGRGHRLNPDFYNLHNDSKPTLTLPTGSTVYYINNAYYFVGADGFVYTIGPNGLELLSVADAEVLLGNFPSRPIGVIGQPPFVGRDVSLPGGASATIFNNNPFWLRRPSTYIPGGPGWNLGTNSFRPPRNRPNFRPRF